MQVDNHTNLALARITSELNKRPLELDLQVMHVTGRNEQLKRRTAALNKPYAIIQHSLRSTRNPNCKDWIEVWDGAVAVWSAYDLYELCRQDGLTPSFNFYYAPFGVAEVFHARPVTKRYLIGCSGDYVTEGVRECIKAARHRVLHLGKELNIENVDDISGVSDDKLAELYSRCHYFSGLRRTEGFELPAAEALLCGAVPILYDQPHYRKWYDDFGVFITENSRGEVIEQLEQVLAVSRLLTDDQIAKARQLFDWDRIIEGFYGHIKSNY